MAFTCVHGRTYVGVISISALIRAESLRVLCACKDNDRVKTSANELVKSLILGLLLEFKGVLCCGKLPIL